MFNINFSKQVRKKFKSDLRRAQRDIVNDKNKKWRDENRRQLVREISAATGVSEAVVKMPNVTIVEADWV